MKPKSALLLWLIAPSSSEYPPLVCVCCLPALCHSKTSHSHFIPRTHQHMPFSFSLPLLPVLVATLFLLLWFRAILSWRPLSGSTVKCIPALFVSQIKRANHPPQIHMPFFFLGASRFLFVDCLPVEYNYSGQGSFALDHPHKMEI